LIVLYLTCSLNADYLQPYTPSVTYTPHLQKFAADALTFQNHYTESGHSGTAYSSILTGSQADVHGVYYHPYPIKPGIEILPQVLESQGFAAHYRFTHAIAHALIRPFTQDVPAAELKPPYALLTELQRDPGMRAVITAAFSVTHAPYDSNHLAQFIETYPHESHAIAGFSPSRIEHLQQLYREHRDIYSYGSQDQLDALGLDPQTAADLDALLDVLYKSRVHVLDIMFGSLVDAIERQGLRDDTLFIFTSDHGEVTGRRNALFRWTHGAQLAPEVLRVPLMIRAPRSVGLKSGDYTGITRSMDLFPTVLDLVGHDPAGYDQVRGANLGPHVRVGGEEAELSAQFHTTLLAPPLIEISKAWHRYSRFFPDQSFERTTWVGLRRGEWVFKWRPDGAGGMVYEAFDHSQDPDETTNRYSAADPRHQRAAEELRAYRERLGDNRARMMGRDLELEEATELLRSLGYVE